MSRPRVYLAGPMTGYHLWNFPEFFYAEKLLRAAGADVISPARHDVELGFDPAADPGEFTEAQLHASMTWDLQQILDAGTDAVVYLYGSDESKGAQLEMSVALAVGKPVLALGQALYRLRKGISLHD